MDMNKLILLLLSSALVFETAETASLGESCDTANDDCTGNTVVCDATTTKCVCATGFTEVTNACKAKIDEDCSDANDCVANTECSGTPKKCQCATDFTSNADKTKCLEDKEIGEACSAADDVCTTMGTACVAEGESTSTTRCLCDGDYVVNSGNTACLKKIDASCSAPSECIANAVCTSSTCRCATDFTSNADKTECLKQIDTACGVASECIANAVCTSTKCQCATDFTSNADKTECLKNLGTSCGSTTVCADGGVCDTNSDSPTCAIGSGGKCDDADSKCVADSECTEEICTCTNGDADETTKLCPSPSRGFLETSSMLVVTVCLWLSMF